MFATNSAQSAFKVYRFHTLRSINYKWKLSIKRNCICIEHTNRFLSLSPSLNGAYIWMRFRCIRNMCRFCANNVSFHKVGLSKDCGILQDSQPALKIWGTAIVASWWSAGGTEMTTSSFWPSLVTGPWGISRKPRADLGHLGCAFLELILLLSVRQHCHSSLLAAASSASNVVDESCLASCFTHYRFSHLGSAAPPLFPALPASSVWCCLLAVISMVTFSVWIAKWFSTFIYLMKCIVALPF